MLVLVLVRRYVQSGSSTHEAYYHGRVQHDGVNRPSHVGPIRLPRLTDTTPPGDRPENDVNGQPGCALRSARTRMALPSSSFFVRTSPCLPPDFLHFILSHMSLYCIVIVHWDRVSWCMTDRQRAGADARGDWPGGCGSIAHFTLRVFCAWTWDLERGKRGVREAPAWRQRLAG